MQTISKLFGSDKITQFLKEYGAIGVTVHFSLYFFTWACMYIAIDYGLITVDDVKKWIKKLKLDAYIDTNKLENTKRATSIALAWILTKLTQPLRIMLTIGVTPFLVRIIRR
jgi:hypothetical protein